MTVKLEMLLGQDIRSACDEAVMRARIDNCQVEFDFNGQVIIVTPETNPEQAAKSYMDECDRLHKEYLASQEYKDRQEELARRELERKTKVDGLLADAPKTMALLRPDEWEKTKAANTDPYGGAVMTYAERWARIMESRMSKGERLEDIADECSHLADEEGITGFMFGAAVSTLAQVWTHGHDLMWWHTAKRGGGVMDAKTAEILGMIGGGPKPATAPEILQAGLDAMKQRAVIRDAPGGERSAGKAADILTAWTGRQWVEEDVWRALIAVKMAREQQGAFHLDDHIDSSSYMALLGECRARHESESRG